MPVLPPVADIVRFAVNQTFGDDLDVENIYHVSTGLAGPYDGADLLAAAQEFLSLWTAQFLGIMSTAISVNSVTAKDVSVALGNTATYVPSSSPAGTVSGAANPANCALCISWKEGISYRGGHPRSYMSGLPEANNADPQHVTGINASSWQTLANAFIASIPGGSWPTGWFTPALVVVHYHRGGVLLSTPIVETILSAVVNTRLDSQRRRLQS